MKKLARLLVACLICFAVIAGLVLLVQQFI